ncbi:disease resistance protein RPH8A-like [Salvia miltiorrhiza]|uniref:disease resistance protein RPH8A-like n=1 Tax=Salvia miltiorrhiza TaxID=226208 RepID=UPI0025AD0D81|nr:disease resistance protein RPH8A-like [Salvia miltiorrhiza]
MAAEAAISSAVELLGNLLIQKVKFLRGVKRNVELLRDELKRMQSFLKDANKKQFEDERVRNWISEMREVAEDAEDTVEMFLLNVENSKSKGLLKRCTRFAKRMYQLNRIGDEIESIRARLDAIDKSRERYGIKSLEEAADSTRRSQVELRRQLAHWEKDEHLVGMEDDVKKLLRESIMDEKKGHSVAVIQGMGGIGKSTLAREIYNHPDVVAGRFECRGWVVVSSEFTPQETIKQLILELPGSDGKKLRELEETTKDETYLIRKLQEMLHQQLQGKNYLIVLDDVWEQQHWQNLKSAFPIEQDKTSRLLITTRNKITAKDDQYVHKMELLTPEQSWELLLKKAFIDGKCAEELRSVGEQILEKCDGLPLAISVVGGLLVETQTKSGWQQVLNQINSYLDKPESNVPRILELSYQNLTPQLKSCFLCLAFFKEDSIIPAKRVIDIWAGMSLIKQEGKATIDEIGRGYLNELINRSMVQNIEQEGKATIDEIGRGFLNELINRSMVQNNAGFINDDRVNHCRLHDLLREVCLSKAGGEMGVKIVKGEDGVSSGSSCRTRHRVVDDKNLEIFSSDQNKHIRSLFILNVSREGIDVRTPSNYWKSFQLLKILDLDGFGFPTLPESLRFLVGLKCLRIRRDQSLFGYFVLTLPSWFDHLKKLEVLDVETEVVLFPDEALKLERLRHFHAYLVDGKPMSIDNWKNIETLKRIRLKDWLEISSTLMASCQVRELGIYINEIKENCNFSAGKASLEKMTNLVELHLTIDHSLSVKKIIPNLDSLTRLILDGGMLTCPAASVFPPNLSHLVLANLDDDPMEELGKLPKLQYLTLSNPIKPYIGCRMKVLHDGFPCLKSLSLRRQGFLTRIDIEAGGMPCLKQLQIIDCPYLKTENLPKHIIISVA